MRGLMRAAATIVAAAATLLAVAAPAGAAPYREVTGPADAPATVIFVHGGGWIGDNPTMVFSTRFHAERFSDTYLAVNTTYRTGRVGFDDVLGVYDELRAQRGPDFPICVWGLSAGGHYALMLAERRDVACAISYAGPTDLLDASPYLMPYAAAAFGYQERDLRDWSPARNAAQPTGPVLLSYAENDPLVTPSQATAMLRSTDRASLVLLPEGDRALQHVHSVVDSTALRAYWQTERRFVDRSVAQWLRARQAPTMPAAPAGGVAPAQPARPAAGQPAAAKPGGAKRTGSKHARDRARAKSQRSSRRDAARRAASPSRR